MSSNLRKNFRLRVPGAFGTVHRANSTKLKKNVALKSLHENEDSKLFYEKFVKELTNITTVNNHDNIINFYGITIGTYYLVLQYAKDGDLRTYLRNNFKSLDWQIKINMAKDITSGLNYIHGENMVHKDLHSKNILVHEGRLLITDLGLSQPLDSNSNSMAGGTYAYTDPEYLRNQKEYKRNKASDIYSLGVLFWELSSGRPPFNIIPNLEILKLVISGKREAPINETPKDYITLYSSAWNYDSKKRPAIENIFDSLENINLENIYFGPDDNQYIQLEASLDVFSRDSISFPSFTISYSGEVTESSNFLPATLNYNDYDNKTNQIINYNYTDFKNLKNIGKGMTYSATFMGGTVALKSIVVATTELFVNELKQYSRASSHENIIKFYGISQKDSKRNEYILVLEYANDGTLRDHLKSNFKTLEWSDKLNLAQQIVNAIEHLHSNEIIHGNLHSKNILLHDETIKISDFGISKLNKKHTKEYSDPILLKMQGEFSRSKTSDIYSIGILLWEISSGKVPYESKFQDELDLKIYVSQGNREDPIIGTPQYYINIYQDCWNQDPNQRPNIEKVVQKLYLANYDISPTPGLPSKVNESFSTIINGEHAAKISSWIDRKFTIYSLAKIPYKFQLILRGSRDGFHPKIFWNMCNGYAGTIVVAKVAGTDEIVGGYNPLSWDNSKKDTYMTTNNSFIFSSILFYSKSDLYGPYFGYTEFLMESNVSDFTQDEQCLCCYVPSCHAYKNPIRSTNEKFSIVDYEVFKIIKN
ncbi:hypothetical protein Glove_165g12 [Diversispora epigaea]|uniref:Protein kinase domain-containing protein n=1 Tax=Diversispora epigaea TaxID=1348612 RepID=A0A397J0B7_9GLOM|nr:hypothetical protein Glove_165g12 [Diversispora epigaea]